MPGTNAIYSAFLTRNLLSTQYYTSFIDEPVIALHPFSKGQKNTTVFKLRKVFKTDIVPTLQMIKLRIREGNNLPKYQNTNTKQGRGSKSCFRLHV